MTQSELHHNPKPNSMNYQALVQRLPDLWGQSQPNPVMSPQPKQVENATATTASGAIGLGAIAPKVSQLLNLALQFLDSDETYCRIGPVGVGTDLATELYSHGESVVHVVATDLDSLPSAEVTPQNGSAQHLDQLVEELTNAELAENIYLHSQGFETFFEFCSTEYQDLKIGLYFYGGDRDYRSVLFSLLLAKTFLAPQALIVIDNLSHGMTQQAVADFVASHQPCQLLCDVAPNQNQGFGNGFYLLEWDNLRWHNNVAKSQPFAKSGIGSQAAISTIRELGQSFEQDKITQSLKHNEEALGLFFLRNYQQAIVKYNLALDWNWYDYKTWHNLAMAYCEMEMLDQALEAISHSLRLNDSEATSYFSLGLILEKCSELGPAIQSYQHCIELAPKHVKAHNNLGNLYHQSGEYDLALTSYQVVTKIDPGFYGAYLNIGNILLQQKNYKLAIDAYNKARELDKSNANIYYNLAIAFHESADEENALLNLGLCFHFENKEEEAVENFKQCLEIQQHLESPKVESSVIYKHLGLSYKNLERFEEAVQASQEAIRLNPENPDLYFIAGVVLQAAGFNQELQNLKRVVQQTFPKNLSLGLRFLIFLPLIYNSKAEINSYRKELVESFEQIEPLLEDNEQIKEAYLTLQQASNFYLPYQGQNDVAIQKRFGSLFHTIMGTIYPQWVQPRVMPPLTDQGKIKVGYLGSCMYGHTVGYLTLGWFKNHDRECLEVYSYSISLTPDQVTNYFQLYSDKFCQIPRQIDRIAQKIIDDQLHILVFLDMTMVPMMMQVASLRLAPIQCKFWGAPVTSGLPTIDYFLTSDLMEGANGADHYSEILVRLPNLAFSYSKPTFQVSKTRADFKLDEKKIIYFSCQSLRKYLPHRDSVFPRIAQQVPQAHFVYIARGEQFIKEQFFGRLAR
jgi:predicted O-linked N-acetylglucosamine transferase (SPINDLY family)